MHHSIARSHNWDALGTPYHEHVALSPETMSDAFPAIAVPNIIFSSGSGERTMSATCTTLFHKLVYSTGYSKRIETKIVPFSG
jgi:hypothetical protein